MKTPMLDWAFGLSALALAALVGVSIVREVERPELAGQILLPALGVVDRCEACHSADRGFTHPGDVLTAHPPERFGCTPCHGGQGWAVTADEAHKAQPDWERPLFTANEREAACGRCHVSGPVAGAPQLTRGRVLLATLGCVGCHDLPEGPETANWRPGPPLGGLKDQVQPAWVRAWLHDPAAMDARHRMPAFRLSELPDGDVESLVAYLFSLPGPSLRKLPEGGDADRGRTAVSTRRCATCHQIEGRGGTVASSLDVSGAKLDPAWLFSYLTGPHRMRPGTSMPDIRLADAEAADVVAYAQEQLVPDTAEPAWAKFAGPVKTERVEAGRALFRKLGCSGCHAVPDEKVPPGERNGVPLAGLGARRVADLPVPTGPTGGQPLPDLPNWVARKILEPQAFDTPGGAPALMPAFAMSPEDALALGIAVAALPKTPPPAPYLKMPPRHDFTPPPGPIAALFDRFQCLVCHRIGDRGGDVSRVPLDGEGARVRPEWLAGFLRTPITIRMAQAERMPVLGLTSAEAESLAAWISLTLGDARVPVAGGEPGDGAQGRKVYDSRHCATCHMLGGAGTMNGPVLDAVGDRLRPEYVSAMLADPALTVGGVERHPGVVLPAAEASAVATYLATLRAPASASPAGP